MNNLLSGCKKWKKKKTFKSRVLIKQSYERQGGKSWTKTIQQYGHANSCVFVTAVAKQDCGRGGNSIGEQICTWDAILKNAKMFDHFTDQRPWNVFSFPSNTNVPPLCVQCRSLSIPCPFSIHSSTSICVHWKVQLLFNMSVATNFVFLFFCFLYSYYLLLAVLQTANRFQFLTCA